MLFLGLSGGLWLASLLSWEARQPEFVVGLLVAASFVPLVWLGLRLRSRPLWALQVPAPRQAVAEAVRRALRDRRTTAINPREAGREGVFRGCDALLRLEDPECLVGVKRDPEDPWTTVLVRAAPRERGTLRAVQDAILQGLG
jgi:hypothetical protein